MPQAARQIEKTITRHLKLSYLEYLPPGHPAHSGADSGQKWPMILFLHGAGERGDNLDLVKIHGLAKIVQTRDLPFVVLSPQCPENQWWSDYLPVLDDMIQSAVDHLDVDPDRVYLTGLSMGGYGTWHMAVEYPSRFAAIAPICGSGPWMYGVHERLSAIAHIPTWVFHGAKDKVVPPGDSRAMVKWLKEAGGDVRLTIYPLAGHDSWTETYADNRLYDWFLSHTRRSA